VRTASDPEGCFREIYDIFEGTEQIHQLVIARAISGVRIESVSKHAGPPKVSHPVRSV
jgi:hypothetical protein